MAGASWASNTKYVYDELGRVIDVIYNDADGDSVCDVGETCIAYDYDAADNRTNVTVTGATGAPPPAPTTGVIVVVPLNGFTIIPLD
ncbi:MAG: hypothetical protein MI723_05180 [Caulobacterales bacterium]|nr:hypothetical protein [Caulobacterales bacterium]